MNEKVECVINSCQHIQTAKHPAQKKKAVVKGSAEIISKKQNRTTNYYLKWKENL